MRGIWIRLFSVGLCGGSGASGTSCAAPLWAGFAALVNEQNALNGNPPLGFANPALYALGKSAAYASLFHDITNGNNVTTTSGNKYYAVKGYDLCTGWGSPAGSNLIGALTPVLHPLVTAQPANVTVSVGSRAAFSVTCAGAAPLSYRWLFNGVALTNGSLCSGTTSNVLTITNLLLRQGGNYEVVVTNSYGAVTSSAAVLAVIAQPPSLQVTAGGEHKLGFKWPTVPWQNYQLQYATNLANGPWIDFGAPLLATNTVLESFDLMTNSQLFYRVVLLP